MKSWRKLTQMMEKKKLDRWSQKNTTHFLIDVATSLWTGLKKQDDENQYSWVNEGNLHCLTNSSRFPIKRMESVSLAQKFKPLLVTLLVTDPFQKSPTLLCDCFSDLRLESLWLTFCCQSQSRTPGLLV